MQFWYFILTSLARARLDAIILVKEDTLSPLPKKKKRKKEGKRVEASLVPKAVAVGGEKGKKKKKNL